MATTQAPEIAVGQVCEQEHPMFDGFFHVVNHPDLSAIVGVVSANRFAKVRFPTDVVLFCESQTTYVTLFSDAAKVLGTILLDCGDALWVPAEMEFLCSVWGLTDRSVIAVYCFGPADLLMDCFTSLHDESSHFIPMDPPTASALANTEYHGCLVASATDSLRRDPFFSNNQLVIFDSDEASNASALGDRKLKVGILFWGKDAEGNAEKAMIHRHGPHKAVTELIRIVCGDMEAWHGGSWAQRSLIAIRGWVWHSWRWMTGHQTALPLDWQTRFPDRCENKFAVMFFIYAEGGKESKGDTTGAPSE